MIKIKTFVTLLPFIIMLQFPIQGINTKTIIDSLEKIATIQRDTFLVKTYNELTWQYRFIARDKAIEYGNKAIQLAIKYNFDKGIAQAYNDLGILYYDNQDNATALKYYNKSMIIRLRIGDKKGVAGIYSKMGVMFQKKGDFIKALENQNKALELYEEINYEFGTAYALNNIAILNYDIGNFEEALKNNIKSAEIKIKINDKLGLSGSYVNISNIYFSKKNYPEAINYNLKALEICRKIGDKEYLSATLNNLGSVYIKKKDYINALNCVKESYELRKEIKDVKAMISCLVNMANIHLKINNTESALTNINEALELSKHANALPEMASIYEAYTNYFETKGDFKSALNNQKLQSFYRDSVLNEDLNSKIVEMNTRYETEKKEKELIQNKLELSQKQSELSTEKVRNNVLFVLFLVAIVLSYTLYTRYKYKQRAAFNQELIHQQELRVKAIIGAEEQERLRIAMELHDGIGQQLSAAKLNLSSLQSYLQKDNKEQQQLIKNILEIVDDSVKEVRNVSHSMMPIALINSGLENAINEFVERIISANKLQIFTNFHLTKKRLNNSIESIIYRVLQEIISNILKHSKAKKVTIQLVEHDNELSILIEDDGIGFDNNSLKSEGIGLRNIKSRIAYLNGKVNFDSVLNKGTTITIEIPLT